jgi:hypothetical protein
VATTQPAQPGDDPYRVPITYLPVHWGGPAPVPAECTVPTDPVETTVPAAVLMSVQPIG